MEGVPALRDIIEKDDFMCKVDLKDAYVVVPVHKASQKYLTFENNNIVYQYTSLAFGLSIAPRVFSKLMRYAVEHLRAKGMRLVYYLDDICVLEKSRSKMRESGEECARAEKDPGISRVSIQHSNNVNLSSNPQSNQVTTANQTSRGTSHTIMPMDSESVREDDSRHPSNRGSSVTYPTHATRFIQKLEDTQSQLGQELQTISPIDGGDHMVEKIFSKEKRSTNSQTTNSRTICQDLQWVKKLHQRNLIFRK
ncbi:hypothetical protein G6F58_012566 [Rhizopus delemar]|nr:hypothetical protein G6F58_012566 [Rhizopus delemar]